MVRDGRKPRKDECRGIKIMETEQIKSDGKMRWEENRWKQKREMQDTECKVRWVKRAGGIMVHLRQREISFRRGPQAALWKWVAGSFFG